MENSASPPNISPPAIHPSKHLSSFLSGLEHSLEQRAIELRSQGHDVINLSAVNPDLPPPAQAQEILVRLITTPSPSRSPSGTFDLRATISRWYQHRFRASIDPINELTTIPTVEQGLCDLLPALIDPGEAVLIPDPCRPIFRFALSLAGAHAIQLPLRPEHDFLPDLKTIPDEDLERARLILLDYPNFPTGATAPASFLHQLIHFAHEHQLLIVRLADYSEYTFEGNRTMSLIEIPGGRAVTVELHSPAMNLQLRSWPLAVAIGHVDAIRYLRHHRSFVMHSLYPPIQQAIGELLIQLSPEWYVQRNAIYQQRRNRLGAALESTGLHSWHARALPALWVATPPGTSSMEIAEQLLEQAHLLVAPGTAFGERGEGYLLFSVTVDDSRLEEVVHRLSKVHCKSSSLETDR
ncbi:MAG: aminotransferase class I/II-fold pyridoxal phosphate-dependent enzyme [Chloroflexi bacterium]|nr:aminotransferase class I/II-fold pyridoxal phosphate-dependent enzyme [Chloroflexota bacterium]